MSGGAPSPWKPTEPRRGWGGDEDFLPAPRGPHWGQKVPRTHKPPAQKQSSPPKQDPHPPPPTLVSIPPSFAPALPVLSAPQAPSLALALWLAQRPPSPALAQVARGQGPTPGSTPSSQAPPGLEKQSSEKEEKDDTAAEAAVPRCTAPWHPGPPPTKPEPEFTSKPSGPPHRLPASLREGPSVSRGHRAGPRASCCSSEAGPNPNPHPAAWLSPPSRAISPERSLRGPAQHPSLWGFSWA